MASKKVTITLPERVVEVIAERAAQADLPISTWMARAAEDRARIEDGLAAMWEWDLESGSASPKELAWADAELARADAETLARLENQK